MVGPELARWWTGDAVHDCDVMDRLLLLLLLLLLFNEWVGVEWSVICAFGRLELDDDDEVYEEWRGDDVADAGEEGRNTAEK